MVARLDAGGGTWPARLRGRFISTTRSTWCLGASLAGASTGLVARRFRLARPP